MVGKLLLLTIGVVGPINCSSQLGTHDSVVDSEPLTPEDSARALKKFVEIEAITSSYRDSLIGLTFEQSAPMFIFDNCFDEKFSYLWPSPSLPISVRKMIIDGIDSRYDLTVILGKFSKMDKQILNKCKTYCTYGEISWYGLFLLRFQELEQIDNLKKINHRE